uniref:Putative ovule protein n=1 Tax=Solanum chacoense TaxID=4108 RepID=A0A0V0IRV1_SOLCH
MGDEITSRFREERVITETLIDSKIAAVEQRLSEKLSKSSKTNCLDWELAPATHRPESYSAHRTGRSTIPATKGNTPPIQLADKNHPTSGNSPLIVQSYAKMNFPTFNSINNPLIWSHHCEQFGPRKGSNRMGELVTLQQTDRIEIYQHQLQDKLARTRIGQLS